MGSELKMKIEGKCHCGNIYYTFHWPGDGTSIPVRECSCSFCTMRGGIYTSHPQAELSATIRDGQLVSKYRFGTRTADFYVCSRCGAVPFVTSQIQGHLYAVVNVNTFEDIDRSILQRVSANFEGEDTENRLARRARTWIPTVSIATSAP